LTETDLTGDGDNVLPLHELIRARMDDRGWSYGQLEHRSDGQLTKGRWQQLGTQTRMKSFPEPDTLRLIARVLEFDETTVVLSAAESLGLDVRRRGSLFAQLMPAGTDLLSDRVRDALLSLIRAAVAEAAAHAADGEETGNGPQAATETYEWPKTPRAEGRTSNTRTGDHAG
jgi:hypothetical protein